jgi:hypothetical protein
VNIGEPLEVIEIEPIEEPRFLPDNVPERHPQEDPDLVPV